MAKKRPWNTVCPNCNNSRAFEGFYSIECPSKNCVYYSKKQEELINEYKKELEEEISLKIYDNEVKTEEEDSDEYFNCYGYVIPP